MNTFRQPEETTIPLKHIVNYCETVFPKLWNELNWRNFRGTEKWNDPRRALADLCTCYGTANREGHRGYPDIKHDPYIPLQIYAALQMLKNKVPIFFVERELLKAISVSSLPHEIEWQTMNLPFESAIFVFPQKSFFIDNNKECPFLTYSRIRAGRYFFNENNYLDQASDMFAITTSSPYQNTNYYYRNTETIRPEEQLELSGDSLMQLNTAEDEAINKFAQVTFGLLLVMNARAELIEGGRYIGKIRRSTREIWLPNVIGRKYRVKRESIENENTETGKHSSPRAHWRRGHFREQPFGTERKEIKTIWIEPTLVGVKAENQ
jgi:hypothetical protein